MKQQQTKCFRDKSADSQSYVSTLISNANIRTSKGQLSTLPTQSNQPVKNINVSKSTLVAVIDNLNLNRSVALKDEGSLYFKKRIDKLNLKFYVETEKYLNNQNDMDRCQDQLFVILFRQISTYSEEVERLNYIIKDLKAQIGVTKAEEDKLDNIVAHNNTLRTLNREMEKKLGERSLEESILKTEIENLKSQMKTLKERLEAELKKSINKLEVIPNVQSNQIQKKGVSSDKLVSLSFSDSKEKEFGFKPTLSMNNFHKKNSKTIPSSSLVSSVVIPSISTQIQVSSVIDYNSTNNTEADINQPDQTSLIGPNIKVKKRNYSDTDPQATIQIKNQKDLVRAGERADLNPKINLVNDLKMMGTASTSKKPLAFKVDVKKETKVAKLKLQNISTEITTSSGGPLKSPTHSNISKINLDESNQTTIFSSNGTRSPPRAIASKGILDEQIANSMATFLDSEINELAEMEILLSRIKQFDEMKIPFAGSNDGSAAQLATKTNKKNILVKKKYQILSSVTIDLSTTQGLSGSERSKSRK